MGCARHLRAVATRNVSSYRVAESLPDPHHVLEGYPVNSLRA